MSRDKMSTLHGAIETIETVVHKFKSFINIILNNLCFVLISLNCSVQLKEGERMSQISLEKAREDVVDSKGKAANYATLCERVNALGSALAQIKSKSTHISVEKAVNFYLFCFI